MFEILAQTTQPVITDPEVVNQVRVFYEAGWGKLLWVVGAALFAAFPSLLVWQWRRREDKLYEMIQGAKNEVSTQLSAAIEAATQQVSKEVALSLADSYCTTAAAIHEVSRGDITQTMLLFASATCALSKHPAPDEAANMWRLIADTCGCVLRDIQTVPQRPLVRRICVTMENYFRDRGQAEKNQEFMSLLRSVIEACKVDTTDDSK